MYIHSDCLLEHTNFEDDLIGYKCICFKNNY